MTLQAAPLFTDVVAGPEGGAAWWVHAADGVRLRFAYWPCEDARGTVLLFPGRTEYVEKYSLAAREFAARGYATVAVDWRGQGLADRVCPDLRVGHVALFSDYQADVDAVMAGLSELDIPQPLHLLGHSMGGAIGLYAATEGLDVASCAFTGPMWGISLSPVVRQVGWALSSLAPMIGLGHKMPPSTRPENYVISQPFEGNALTRDPEMYQMMIDQVTAHPEAAIGGPTFTWLRESLKVTRLLANRPSPRQPGLAIVGSAERIIDVDRIRARMEAWPNGDIWVVPDAEHEVMMEVPATRIQVFDRLTAHFDAAATQETLAASA